MNSIKLSHVFCGLSLLIASTGQALAATCSTSVSPYTVNCDGSDVSWTSGPLVINSGVTLSDTSNFIVNNSSSTFINNGTIVSSQTGGNAFISRGTVTSVVNNGSITGSFSAFQSIDQLGSFTNNGTITGANYGIYNGATIATFINNSLISGPNYSISNSGTIDVLTNSGTLSGTFNNSRTINTFNNSGSITGGVRMQGMMGSPVIGTIINTGTITGAIDINMVFSGTSITTLKNTGSIGGISISNIFGGNAIANLHNSQGASSSALTYTGKLPTNYNIIINAPTDFGRLAITSPSGTTTFGIYADSILSAATYSSVLTGVTSSSIANYGSIFNTWNNFSSAYKWQLVAGSSSSVWDLQVATRASSILSGSTNLLSAVGVTLNPVLDGGILKIDSATSTSTAFTIKSTGGRIDANGLRSVFSGSFSNAIGDTGKLTIVNTGAAGQGAVVLLASNTHSGGTEVQAGANLSISSSDALGAGTLALVGSSTVPAILTTTADMTISNPITVSGDPTFNVASGTTTTVSVPITDGISSGDVVVSGGGTLELTAVNTYTGPTTVDSGSTLALSSAGSITPSSSVTNNGTFNITGKTGNVSVAGYTQSSTGILAMNYSPTSNQKLLVAGVAYLAGGLTLIGSSGTYQSGKYALLSASGVTGTFGSLSSNLSSLTTLGYQLAYDSANVYLVFTPNAADTQQSLVNTASVLQNTYTLQNSVVANSFSYDCTEFGANNVCISVGGRNTAVQAANGLNNTSALLIAAYRPHQHYRIGAYADQNLSVSNPGGTVNLGNNTPLIGLFGAWNERLDGTGTEIKVSAAYGQKNTTITRSVVGTSEPGTGSSQLNSQGAQLTAKYGFAVTPAVIGTPYIGIRYTQNNMNGYTEGTSSSVTAPLTYAALNTNATTALFGLGVSYKLNPVVTTFVSAGVETDTNTSNGTYSATGISGLTPINFNANPVKTRPTATLGAYYDVAKNQRVGVTGIYRQEAYQAVSTTTVMATYTIGL